jgi:hypothetical protein
VRAALILPHDIGQNAWIDCAQLFWYFFGHNFPHWM